MKLNFDENSTIRSIRYKYDATGVKLEKNVMNEGTISTQYAGGFIYNNNGGDQKPQFFSHPERYVEPVGGTERSVKGFEIGVAGPTYSSYNYVFQYKDHLGNVRLSYSDSDLNGAITPDEIIEESNYYPFGLQHKGYNINISPSGNSLAQKFKYNGIELEESLGLNLYEMYFRNYDPAIGRFNSIDPVVHFDFSTYSAFDNNPAFWADPSGADAELDELINQAWNSTEEGENATYTVNEETRENDDKITVNSKGVITDVKRDGGPNRFFDQDGNELFFHDSEGVDKPYTEFKYNIDERLFNSISIEEINNEIIRIGIIMERYIGQYYIRSLGSALVKSHLDYDFAEKFLVSFIKSPGSNDSNGRANYNEDAGFFRFGNTNNIYNLYDGGNYMWGRAMRLFGFNYEEVKFGSKVNSILTLQGIDSKADQNAIKNGFNGN